MEFLKGGRCPQNNDEAIYWMRRAAEQGDDAAQAVLERWGRGTPRAPFDDDTCTAVQERAHSFMYNRDSSDEVIQRAMNLVKEGDRNDWRVLQAPFIMWQVRGYNAVLLCVRTDPAAYAAFARYLLEVDGYSIGLILNDSRAALETLYECLVDERTDVRNVAIAYLRVMAVNYPFTDFSEPFQPEVFRALIDKHYGEA
jgi:hypothetical protein